MNEQTVGLDNNEITGNLERRAERMGLGVQRAYNIVRSSVMKLEHDRVLAPDIAALTRMVKEGAFGYRIYCATLKALSKSPAPSLTPGSGSSPKRRVMNLMIDVVSYGV